MSENRRTIYIRFHAMINQNSINALISNIQQKINEGVNRIVILINSTGGNVFNGVHAYNFLKGLPIEIVTHNVGSANSVAVVLFCAGTTRYCSPHARFLIHGVVSTLNGTFELNQLEEVLTGLRNNTETIAEIVASTTGKTKEEIMEVMAARSALSSNQSVEFDLSTEIKEEVFEAGAEVIHITENQ